MFQDPIVEAYKKDIDRTLIRENLKLTVEERFRKAPGAFSLTKCAARAKRLDPREKPSKKKARF